MLLDGGKLVLGQFRGVLDVYQVFVSLLVLLESVKPGLGKCQVV